MLTAQKMKFPINDFLSIYFLRKDFPQETADLVTITEEVLHGKLHFFCSGFGFFVDGSFEIDINQFLVKVTPPLVPPNLPYPL